MKFKVSLANESKNTAVLSCLDWLKNDEVYTISDDNQILKWSTKTRTSSQVARLPDDFIPTDLHWICNARSGGPMAAAAPTAGAKGLEVLLITSSDGRFVILNRSARVERNVAAHQSAINVGRWSPDGSGLLTASEDGSVKVWSKLGMLRSHIVQNEKPIRTVCWSPNSMSIAFCTEGFIAVKPLAPNSKLMKWRAHDGSISCISWSNETQYIASGGDDCRFKIWDCEGALIHASPPEDYDITSLQFCPNGLYLAVGGFNMLKLCHITGWAYSNLRFSEPAVGSLFNIRWSQDGTQITSGSGSGRLLFGHIIEHEKTSRNLKAKTVGRKIIELQNIINRTTDKVDVPERIIKWDLGYGHLVIATITQVHIYNEKYTNTPLAIIDGRNDVRILILGKKNFLIADNMSVSIFTYTGRLQLMPKYTGLNLQLGSLREKIVSLGPFYLAIRNATDEGTIHVFDLVPGASRQTEPNSIQTKMQIKQIAVSRAGKQDDQYIVFIDNNRDLFGAEIKNDSDIEMEKIGTQLLNVMWGSESNILVGLHDACYSIWYCPGESWSDPIIMALSTITVDITEMGNNITLENFEGSIITFKGTGTTYPVHIITYCEMLHRLLNDDNWTQALRICRRANIPILWSTLAAIAAKKTQLDICEESYAAVSQTDKVEYLSYIKDLPANSPEQMAEIAVFQGRINEAETILLHNKNFKLALEICLRLHRWERALEIAKSSSNPSDLQSILLKRKQYLAALNCPEYIDAYKRMSQVNGFDKSVDEDKSI